MLCRKTLFYTQHSSNTLNYHKPSLPPQVIASAGSPSEYFLCEEKVPLLKERSEVKRCAQHRPLAPEEEVVRLVWGWTTEEGYVGRICLKLRDEVHTQVIREWMFRQASNWELFMKKDLLLSIIHLIRTNKRFEQLDQMCCAVKIETTLLKANSSPMWCTCILCYTSLGCEQ